MIEHFLQLLIEATARIPEPYFWLPVAGREDPIYRERVYCYELYHQIRTLLEHVDAFEGYLMSGEIDKRGHPIIRPCIPDFVFHHPGTMDNLAVIEVKPVNGAPEGMLKDRETLKDFLSEDVGYKVGVELVYGDDEAAFENIQQVFSKLNTKNLRLLWHRYQGQPAIWVH
jgi:hypothetical protein